MNAIHDKPLDARLAILLVRPLAHTWVRPNHLTGLRLLTGLAAVAAVSTGAYSWSNTGAVLFVLSNFLDHGDGELARISGHHSRLGHLMDLFSDALIHTLIFVALGIAEYHRDGALLDLGMGVLAGLAVSGIFHLRYRIEERLGKEAIQQPGLSWFEAEDILYLFPLVTLYEVEDGFLLAAAIGAPLALLGVAAQYFGLDRHHRDRAS